MRKRLAVEFERQEINRLCIRRAQQIELRVLCAMYEHERELVDEEQASGRGATTT